MAFKICFDDVSSVNCRYGLRYRHCRVCEMIDQCLFELEISMALGRDFQHEGARVAIIDVVVQIFAWQPIKGTAASPVLFEQIKIGVAWLVHSVHDGAG